MPKGTSWVETMSNSEKIKPVALAIIKLCLTEGISQSVRRKFCYIIFFKIPWKAFQVDLKACLGLVLPNQYYPIVIWEN